MSTSNLQYVVRISFDDTWIQGRTKPLSQGGLISRVIAQKKLLGPPSPPLKIKQKAVNCYFLFVQKLKVYKHQFSHFLSVNSSSPTFYL